MRHEVNELKRKGKSESRTLTEWAFAVSVIVFIVSAGVIGAHYSGVITDLEARQVPDTAFVFTTAVIAEARDREGNLVQRVEKWGDLPTTNWGYFFASQFGSINAENLLSEFNATVGTDITGTDRDISLKTTYQADILLASARVGWGTGDTAPDISQYELVTKTDWDTVDGVDFFVNSTHMWIRIKMTSELDSATTVYEVALYTGVHVIGYGSSGNQMRKFNDGDVDNVYGTTLQMQFSDLSGEQWQTNTVGDSLGRYMLFRDVLGTPLSVSADEALTVIYYLYFEYA